MTNLEGLDLPDRQFAVFCKSHFSPSSEGCFLPPSAPSSLIVSYFISIWQLYLIMMAVELNKYWRNYIAEFYQ